MALAFLLTKGGKKRNAAKRFVILHVDHALRKESKEEYRFVRNLAKRLGVPFIWRACKPLASGIRRAAKLLDRPLGEGAVIGDQLYTDIGAANLAGVKALLVDPLAEDYESFIVFKRRLEKRHHQKNQHIKQKTLSLLK